MSVQDRAVPGVATEVIRVGPFAVHETEFAIEVTSDEVAAVNEALLVDMRSAGAVVPIVYVARSIGPAWLEARWVIERDGTQIAESLDPTSVGMAALRDATRQAVLDLEDRVCLNASVFEREGRAVLLASAADDVGASPHGRWGLPAIVERLLADGWSAVVTSAFALIERGSGHWWVHSDWRPLFVSRLVALDDRHAFVGTNTPVAASSLGRLSGDAKIAALVVVSRNAGSDVEAAALSPASVLRHLTPLLRSTNDKRAADFHRLAAFVAEVPAISFEVGSDGLERLSAVLGDDRQGAA